MYLQVSRDAPPPLPGGYKVGKKVLFTGASETVSTGDKLVHGQQGEVTGPATLAHKGKGVALLFPGNKRNIECDLTTVRRLPTASAATHACAPQHATRTSPRALLRLDTQPRRPDPHCRAATVQCPGSGRASGGERGAGGRRAAQERQRGLWPRAHPLAFWLWCGRAQVSRNVPPALHSTAGDQGDGEEVAIVGERTLAQRDAEGRKRAINLEYETPRKRGRAMAGAMEERIVGARSVCTAAVDKRVRELAQPALDEYMADRIDAAELDRRKTQARQKATAEHAPLTELDRASTRYMEAVSARTKAEAALSTSEAAEDAAEAKLEAVLHALEQGQPGASQA